MLLLAGRVLGTSMRAERRSIVNMKGHVLTALREQFDRWEALLEGMSAEQTTALLSPSYWSTKDVIAHLMAWHQRSIARVEAAVLSREPVFPTWLPDVDPDSNDSADETNAWLYEAYRAQTWSKVHRNWREGFLRFLELGDEISERDLLDWERYPWMEGLPLIMVVLGSYDHHQEHLDKLVAWLQEHGGGHIGG